MDITQIIISISLLAVSTVIVISGIYLINLLKDIRLTVQKTNSILDDTQSITSSISKPLNSVSEFVMGFKNGITMFNNFFKKEEK